MSSEMEWQAATWKGTTASNRLQAVQKTAHRKMAQPVSEDVGNLVKTLTEVKADLRAEQAAYLSNLRATRKPALPAAAIAGGAGQRGRKMRTPKKGSIDKTFPLKWGMNPQGSSSSGAVAPAPEDGSTAAPTEHEKPVELQLLGYIERKQAALEASKAELQRSLAATREMEKRFDEERRRLLDAENRDRHRQLQQSQQQWNPFAPDAALINAEIHHSKREESKENSDAPYPHAHDWRLSEKDASISLTPRSHGAAGAMVPQSSSKKKSHPAGKTYRTSSHPNHVASSAPAVDSSPVDARLLMRSLPANKKTILDLFRNYDVNCTGAINSNEFSTGLIQAGVQLSMPQMHSLIQKLDRENRGEIRYINLIETDEESFRGAGNGDASSSELPERWFNPPAGPEAPAVYVPIPPYGSFDPAVDEALRTRNKQSSALAIQRVADRTIRQADGSIVHSAPLMPLAFRSQTDANFAVSGPEYFPREIGFKEEPYRYSLGPTNLISNPTAHPHDFRASNSREWGAVNPQTGSRDPQPLPGEFERDYSQAVLDPTSVAGSSIRSISERVAHNPIRFSAMMRTLDLDRDQRVTHKEFLTGLERLGLNVPLWRIKNLLQQVDRHGTGSVKYEEVAGLLDYYAKEEKQKIAERQAAADAASGVSQVNPLSTPGFTPSIHIPLHSQPTWLPSIGQGNNLEKFAEARRVEREWSERVQREQEMRQEEQERAAEAAREQAEAERREQERQAAEGPMQHWEDSPHYRPNEQQQQQQREEIQPQFEADAVSYSAPPVAISTDSPPTPATPISSSPRASASASAPPPLQLPQSPAKAHYANMQLTSEETERLEEKRQREQREQQPFAQQGSELPVLDVEYPDHRSRTPGPGRSRSRSNSISSVRSQTPSHKRAAGVQSDLHSSFREAAASSSSRNGSRRGSFAQAGRGAEALGNLKSFFYDNDQGKFLRLKLQPPTPRAAAQLRMQLSNSQGYWGGEEGAAAAQNEGGRRGRLRTASDSSSRRSASVAALASSSTAQEERARALEVDEMGSSRDAELFKIMRLSMPAPLSRKAMQAVSGRNTPAPLEEQQQQQQQQVAEEAERVSSTPSRSRSLSRSRSSFDSSGGPAHIRRDSSHLGVAVETPSAGRHSYGLNYGAWSDRRARDYFGSNFSLG